MLSSFPDYRLFPQVRFPTFNEDAALAVKWTSDNLLRLGGHPSRLFLMGTLGGRAYLRDARPRCFLSGNP
jgi:hypothetical protein